MNNGGCIAAVVAGCVVLVLAYVLVSGLSQYSDAEAQRIGAEARLTDAYGRSQAEIARAQADKEAQIVRANAEARAAVISANSQARLDQAIAEGQMVLAQGQARLDSAQAFAVTAGAALPWLVTALVGVSGLVLIAAVVAMLVLAVRVTQVNRQDRLLLALAMQGILPERRDYLALREPEREHVIEL